MQQATQGEKHFLATSLSGSEFARESVQRMSVRAKAGRRRFRRGQREFARKSSLQKKVFALQTRFST
jgi:hypothetical protein